MLVQRNHCQSFVLVFQCRGVMCIMLLLAICAETSSAALASWGRMPQLQQRQALSTRHCSVARSRSLLVRMSPTSSSSSAAASTSATGKATKTAATGAATQKRPPPRAVFLTHERDFFRQEARLNSMESYVLVSTLTASMSFGCLVGFCPQPAAEVATAVTNILGGLSTRSVAAAAAAKIMPAMPWFYKALCLAIQIVSGLSALCGLYATIIFSLTILYGKSALGAERDREYDKFLRRTVRARVHGARCFSWSMGLFAVLALLVLLERTCRHVVSTLPIACVGAFILYHLYKDWKLLFNSTEIIYKD